MVATGDRSINLYLERIMTKRAHAMTIEANSSHVAHISHPEESAKLIEQAALSVSANQ
jgi:UDP-N-acetyl-D-mannosaminuronic acid transferase (WecB/TagA/CpsF family)